MRILVTNDDGVGCEGTHILAKVVKRLGDVTVVVPHRERSTVSHCLTLHKPLRIHPHGEGVFSVSGTPADCVYLGIREIMGNKPDLVISGINRGANLGTDIHYSGTVAAAREGALVNIPSYAFSLVGGCRPGGGFPKEPLKYDMAAEISVEIVAAVGKMNFPPFSLLNVNIPNMDREQIRGIKVARQGTRFYASEVVRRTDPRGNPYYWIGGTYQGFEKSSETDCHFLEQGFVSVVPLGIDCTHEDFYEALRSSTELGW